VLRRPCLNRCPEAKAYTAAVRAHPLENARRWSKDRTGYFSVSPKYVLDFMPGLRMNSLNQLTAWGDHCALALVRNLELLDLYDAK
jgi:hypothetical protein